MVVCSHLQPPKPGSRSSKAGGNAYDAAITTQFALAVVYPRAGNIGGGGLMTGRDASGKMLALDWEAPLSATTEAYSMLQAVPDKSLLGIFAAGVPELWTKCGPYKEKAPYLAPINQPAINLAEMASSWQKWSCSYEWICGIDRFVSGFKTAFGAKWLRATSSSRKI